MAISAATIIAISMVGLAAQDDAPAAPFEIDAAARCAAVFAFTLDAMEGAQNVPRQVRKAMHDGLAMWEYELHAAVPVAEPEALQRAANLAVANVRADLPSGDGPEAAQARGNFLTMSAQTCQQQIASAYGDQEHPVIPFLRQAEVAVTAQPPAPVPVSVTVEAEPAPKRQRVLR